MNDRLKAVQSLLLEALEIEDAEERGAFLLEACGTDNDLRRQVEALVAAQSAAGQFLPDRPSTNAAQAAWAGVAYAAASPNDQLQATVTEKAGDRISHYRLLEKLGEGGCGVVYMAEQEKPVRRKVALKVIKLGMDTKSVVARFEAERQALALMDHPNIARVLDAGATESGRPFFVMELVRGVRITKYCDQEQLSVRQRLELFIQVCQAVQHAHQKGIIHRDLKPSNILVTVNDGAPVPKVIDFGIAKATSGRLTDNTLFTAFEQFLGTPAYMSPEQAAMTSLDIDTRSDIYSLGVLLYELLTGKTPFDTQALLASGIDELRRTICEREPLRPSNRLTMELEATKPQGSSRTIHQKRAVDSLGRVRILDRVKFIRGDLDWIVMKCLEKDRARRYETANGLARDIERYLSSEAVVARPPSTLYRWQKVIQRNKLAFAAGTALALVLVLGAVVSTWQAVRVEHERQQIQSNVVRQYVARGTELVNNGDLFGSLLWYTEALRLDQGDLHREEPHRIRIASVLNQCPRLLCVLSHGKTMREAEFSPDGSRVVTASDDHTARVWDSTTGKQLLLLPHKGEVYDARFSRDGLLVITCGQDKTVRIWNSRTGSQLQSLLHPATVRKARLSPDTKLAATACDDKRVRFWNTATGIQHTEILTHESSIEGLDFSPDGRLLVTSTEDSLVHFWDVATGQSLFQYTDGELANGGYADLQVRFSPDSAQFITCDFFRIHVLDSRSFKELPGLSFDQDEILDEAVSPDGSAIVAGGFDGTVRVWDATTGQSRFSPPVQHDGIVTSVRISPDGRFLASGGNDAVAKICSTSTGQLVAPPLKTILQATKVTFAPDGRRLLVKSADQASRVWDMAASDLSGPRRPELVNEHRLITPDGRYVLVRQVEDNTVWITDAFSGNRLVALPHTDCVTYASFSRDGRTIITAAQSETRISNDISLWEVSSGRKLNLAPMQQGHRVLYVAFSQDNTCLLTCGFDFSAQLWDARTGKPRGGLMRHGQPVLWGGFSPDGRSVVTLCRDKTARAWDGQTGQPLTPPLHHKSRLVQASWSKTGKWLYTLTDDDYIQVWDLTTGEPLTPPRKVRDPKDEDTASTVQTSSSEAPPLDKHSVSDLVRLSQMLGAGRIDQTGNLVPLELDELTHDWKLLRNRFPEQFSTKSAEVAAWHIRESRASLGESNLTAAVFHLHQASGYDPQNKILAQNYENVRAALSLGPPAAFDSIARQAFYPPRNPRANDDQIDLSSYYNVPIHGPGSFGYGPLREGLQDLGGVMFDIRGVIQLNGLTLKKQGSKLPERINGIRVNRRCKRLHFLQANQYTESLSAQPLVGKYVLHYEDGTQAELPIVYGHDISDWWQGGVALLAGPASSDSAVPVWTGDWAEAANMGCSLWLYKSTRNNPRPDVKLETIDFVSNMSAACPFLLALTVE